MTTPHHSHALPPEVIRIALEDAPDASLIVDFTGTIRFANQSAADLFGRSHGELIGRSVEALIPARFRGGHTIYRDEFANDKKARPMGGHRLDLFGLRADGSEFPVAISLRPVACKPESFIVAAIRDVTANMEAARALQEAREQADRANLAKSRFLATASHDLRQPLQSIGLLNGALRRVVADRPTAVEALMQQEQAITSMSRLLNSLLDISKLEAGVIRPDPSDFLVSALFQELHEEFSNLAGSKGLSFKVSACEESVHSDPSLVGQILRNLVSNAIKYTRQGSVTLRCLQEGASAVRVEVLDTGIGIPADQLHQIYDEFYQVGGPHNPEREGYGLGLSIVRRLITLLGLKLEVQSELGQGSLFAVTLPASRTAVSPGRPIKSQPLVHGSPDGARILLVEDDAGVRNATRMLLKSEGYDVTAVASLAEAVEHVGHDPQVSLLVTDYHLGNNETGTQVIASVREAIDRPVQAVLVTGDTSSTVQMLPPDPLTRTVSKPLKAEEFLGLLRTLLAGT
jgi:PAS domain S-box-containing protein